MIFHHLMNAKINNVGFYMMGGFKKMKNLVLDNFC
jgi:hypothetical protein